MAAPVPTDGAGPSSSPRSRVLVFIVAYQAERHAASVLDRIPAELWNQDSVHFLMIDDASSDRTTAVANEWVARHGVSNITLLRNPVNQGYGGNQKLGYRIAIDASFDFVILLHGDGQYAPELLPELIASWRNEDADVVLGSRMHSVREARRGGMPWYKLLGNRVLTVFQNRLTGGRLSEYHTGYRGYSTRFLRAVPFETDTNDFHFDTEILLQAFHVGARIVEVPIPTHYGDEVCRVQGMRYAKNVFLSTLQFRLHQLGMLCTLKYRSLTHPRYRDKTDVLYSSHIMALRLVEELRPRTLLDIGCGPGHVARQCEMLGVHVTGVDCLEPEPGAMTAFHQVDLDREPLPVDAFDYDMVLLLDVLEHVMAPEEFMLGLRNRSRASELERTSPTVLISTPNVAFAAMRLNLLLGRFSYAERGILDMSHKRLFTRSSLRRLLRDCGYAVDRIRGVPVPFEVVIAGRAGHVLGWVAAVLARLWPTMFAFQFLVTCRPRPGLMQLLRQSEKHLGADLRLASLVASAEGGAAVDDRR